MDNHSVEERSYNMSRIRSKGTKPEELVRKYLFSQGFHYRKNVKKLPGKPDIVLKKYKTIIWVNGCFWHGHEGCTGTGAVYEEVDMNGETEMPKVRKAYHGHPHGIPEASGGQTRCPNCNHIVTVYWEPKSKRKEKDKE